MKVRWAGSLGLGLLLLPVFIIAEEHDFLWMRQHATDEEAKPNLKNKGGGISKLEPPPKAPDDDTNPRLPLSETTGNPNLDYVHHLQNQQAAAEAKQREAIMESSVVTEAGKASIEKFAKRLSARCKGGRVQVNNWKDNSGLTIAFVDRCRDSLTKAISSLGELKKALKVKSVQEISFQTPDESYRTFPGIAVEESLAVTTHGYNSVGGTVATRTVAHYVFRTSTLDEFLRGQISTDDFNDQMKTVSTEEGAYGGVHAGVLEEGPGIGSSWTAKGN